MHDLSGMLRYVLYDSEKPSVPLSKEISFLKDYIKLMS
ncbi:MAG: histidine kinase, partial [Prevotella sp.]|nr:histidine kinase [Prevotella sp.]